MSILKELLYKCSVEFTRDRTKEQIILFLSGRLSTRSFNELFGSCILPNKLTREEVADIVGELLRIANRLGGYLPLAEAEAKIQQPSREGDEL